MSRSAWGWRATSAAAPATRTSSRRSWLQTKSCVPPTRAHRETGMATVAEHYVGGGVLRKEDPELLTGEARFVDDLTLPGMVWMAVARSPFAHAKIISVDLSKALAVDGVLAAFSGQDLAGDWIGSLPCAWPVTEDINLPPHWPLAKAEARHH